MSRIKKVILCCLSVPLIILSMCPTFAYAVDFDVVFPFAEPYVNENQGYIVYECKDANGNYSYFLYYITCFPVDYASNSSTLPVSTPMFTVLAPTVSSNTVFNVAVRMDNSYSYFAQGTFYYTSGQPFYQDPIYQTSGGTLVNLEFGVPSKLTLTNYYCRGPWQTQGGVVPFDPTLRVGFLGDDSDYYSQLQSIITKLSTLHSDNIDLVNKFVEAINNLSTLHSDNVEQLGKLVEIINGVVQLHSDNVEILEEFATLLSDTAYIKNVLDLICNYLTEDQMYLLWELDYELMDINTRLDTIIDILRSSGESNLTSPDSSNVDDYYEIEQGLINRSDVDVSNVVNVQIDQNAMSFTWNLLDTILNSNGKVFGLTLTVLSLGIIALILGR